MNKIKSLIFFFIAFTAFKLPALSLIPDSFEIEPGIEKQSVQKIQSLFSDLETKYATKTANNWRLKYHKALLLKKKQPEVFCEIMKELGGVSEFPLKDLALIESYEFCAYSEEPLFSPDSFPEWLRLKLAHSLYKRRKIFDQPERTLQVLVYMAKQSSEKDLRVSYLQRALFLAKKQKKKELITELKSLLYQSAPRLNPKISPSDYLSVAEDFRQNREFKKAIRLYIKILNSAKTDFEEKNQAFKGLDRIYKVKRNYKRQIVNFRQWSEWLLKENTEESLTHYYRLQLKLAQKEWNLNENQKAIEIITSILEKPESELIKEEALYLRGLIYAQENQLPLSLQDWDQVVKILQKNKSDDPLLTKILWKKAWLLRKQKKYRKSLKNLKKLEKLNENPYMDYRILFWKGRTYQNLKQKYQAKKTFLILAKKDPFGYYGLLAHKILNRPAWFPDKDLLEEALTQLDKKIEPLFHWLVLFEYSDLLSQFLDEQELQLLNKKQRTEEEWLKMLWLWIKAKKYLEAFQSLEKMDDSIKNPFLKKYIYLLFPLEFSEEVKRASQKWKIPEELIFSVIRQESAFHIRARSPADAFGLMQLLPSTARYTARQFQIPYRNFRDLYRASKNILLGTAYLKKLLEQYDNSFIFSLSAYNAGDNPLKKWKEAVDENEEFDSLEFIENIPYEETRTYVRLIIRNYVLYHNQLNRGEDWFPEWLLQ